jgi:general secretion pathway protein N
MISKRRLLWALALAMVLLACLLATAPSRLLGLLLPADQVLLQGFSGTLWRGSASRCLVRVGPGYLHLGAVSWELQPLSLLLFAPRLHFESRWGGQTLDTDIAVASASQIVLRETSASLPADLLRQFVPVSLAGTLSIQLEAMRLRDGWPVEGAGRLVWQRGAWRAPAGPVPLGTYALDFSQAPGAELVGEVVTLTGPVNAEGGVRLHERTYTVELSIQAEGGLDERLQQALSLMARPVGSGYRLQLEGELQNPATAGS